MTRPIIYCVSVLIQLNLVVFFASQIFAQSVSYDCPAVVEAKILEQTSAGQKVEVSVPISISNLDEKLKLQELRVDVFWNRNPYPIVDYAPRTQLQSIYDGPIAIENKIETNIGLNAKTSTDYFEFVSPSLSAEAGRRNTLSRRFSEVPQQEILVASGTAKRGTGAFFSFKKSRVATLEGDRQLVLEFDVPVTWRGGILQVTIETKGRRKRFASFNDEFEFARAYMLPVYLQGDTEARHFAYQFARSEQRLRNDWQRYLALLQPESGWFSSNNSQIPNLWAHQLIQGGADSLVSRYQRRLPKRVVATATDFVKARKDLVAISY